MDSEKWTVEDVVEEIKAGAWLRQDRPESFVYMTDGNGFVELQDALFQQVVTALDLQPVRQVSGWEGRSVKHTGRTIWLLPGQDVTDLKKREW